MISTPATTTPKAGRHQRCWAHLLRDLHDLKEAHAAELETVIWAKAESVVYLLAKEWLAQDRARERAYRELVLLIRALGEQFAQAKGHPCQTLAKRLLRHQDELFVFVREPGVSADNNLAERSLSSAGGQPQDQRGNAQPSGESDPHDAHELVSDVGGPGPQSLGGMSSAAPKSFPPPLKRD